MIIVVGSEKGGTGKSTVTTNLSVEFRRRGKSVVVVDGDKQRSTARWAADREEAGHAPSVFVVEKLGSLHETLGELDKNYDIVLVDVAGKDSREMRTAMTAAHQLIVVSQPSQFDLDTVGTVSELINTARDFNPDLRARFLLTRISTNVWESESADARDYLGDYDNIEPLRTAIYERKAYRSVVGEGRGVVEGTNSKAKQEIRSLAEELMN